MQEVRRTHVFYAWMAGFSTIALDYCNLLDFLHTFETPNSGANDLTADLDSNLGHKDVVAAGFATLHCTLNGWQGEIVEIDAIPAHAIFLKDAALTFLYEILEKPTFELAVEPLVYTLVQHACVKTSPKANRRAKNVATICQLIEKSLGSESRQKFVEWLRKLAGHSNATNRVVAVEVGCMLLLKMGKNSSEKGLNDSAKQILMQIVVKRCSDNLAAVRTRALGVLCDLLQENARGFLEMIGTLPNKRKSVVVAESCVEKIGLPTSSPSTRSSLATVQLTPNPRVVSMQDGDDGLDDQRGDENEGGDRSLLRIIVRRCADEKVFVRKTALQALQLLVSAYPDNNITEEMLQVLRDACVDPTLTVRKQGIQTVTSLLQNSTEIDNKLEAAYLQCVLPCLLDSEVTVQEKCVESLTQLIVDLLSVAPNSNEAGHLGAQTSRCWRLLFLVEKSHQFSRYLTRFIQKMALDRALTLVVVKNVQFYLKSAQNGQNCAEKAAWLVLAEISEFCDFSPNFALDFWFRYELEAKIGAESLAVSQIFNYVAKILANHSKSIESLQARRLFDDLKMKFSSFNVNPQNTSAFFNLMRKMSIFLNIEQGEFKQICSDLILHCQQCLSDLVYKNQSDLDPKFAQSSSQIVRRLATLGELVQLKNDSTDDKQLFYILQAVIVSRKQPTNFACPSQLSGSQSQHPQVDAIRVAKVVDQRVRATAVSALGKLCLRDEQSAKRCVDALALELTSTLAPSSDDNGGLLRNNCVVVLCDLCIRYTSLVDRHDETLAACLCDTSQLVRKQTLTLLTSLLKEDYLKWRGLLFYRFLTSLLDRHPDVRSYVEFCLVNVLAERQPLMFFNHFLDSIYALNDAQRSKNGNFSVHLSTDLAEPMKNNASLGVSGLENRTKRMHLYTFMLQRLTDQQRFQTMVRICQEILGSYIDEGVPSDQSERAGSASHEILRDSLQILAHQDLKLTSLTSQRSATAEGEDEPDVGGFIPTMAMAAGRQVAELARKNLARAVKQALADLVVPALVSLKHALEKGRSQLLRHLLHALRELCKDYRTEIDEIFAIDPQLAAEILYDLKRFERMDGRPSLAVISH